MPNESQRKAEKEQAAIALKQAERKLAALQKRKSNSVKTVAGLAVVGLIIAPALARLGRAQSLGAILKGSAVGNDTRARAFALTLAFARALAFLLAFG